MQGLLVSKPKCPNCKTTLDGFTDPVGNRVPQAESVTMCLYCGEILQFDSNMKLKPIPEEIVKELNLRTVQLAGKIRQRFLERRDNTQP